MWRNCMRFVTEPTREEEVVKRIKRNLRAVAKLDDKKKNAIQASC